jgi:glycosidase
MFQRTTRRGFAALALALLAGGVQAADPACRPDPLDGRALYLRGGFNNWGTADAQKFVWACNRYVLVTRISGEHIFKVGDEGWSADADFGRSATEGQLALRGPELKHRFDGTHRITLTMNDKTPTLAIESCPAPAPLGDTVLFLRGSMNNWGALDDYAFQYSCDAYYLNVKLTGRQEFKIADVSWKEATTYGSGPGANLVANGGGVVLDFNGEHTLRLAFEGGKPRLTLGPKTFADPLAKSVNDPVALSVAFDSRKLQDKAPFGAVPSGTQIDFALNAAPGVTGATLVVERRRLEGNQEVLDYTEVARVPLVKASNGAAERWAGQYRFDATGIYGYWFEVQIGGQRFAYQNNSDPIYWTREKGSGGVGSISDLPRQTRSIRRFRQTVHAPNLNVPDWAPDVVYYYVFPDRFRNGDKSNDPKPGVDRYQNHTVELHKNWNDKPWKPGTGDGSDSVYNNDFFGGDLGGIIEKLDYIRDLGANTIYMTPVFRAASNHKYDTADYKTIDPAFGSNEDFARLCREAAKRGIRVIPDASLNHTGSDSIYFDRFGNFKSGGAFANGKINPASPWASWYSFDATQQSPDAQYRGWVGVKDLPELNKASPAFRKFAFGDPDSVMKLWLDRGAAGWRMDVAPWVPDDFWREWRSAIKTHRPDALTVAETWFDSSKFFLGDMFDSTMNYIFRNTLLDYANGGDARKLYGNLELMREAYPKANFYALMNLLSSHDQARSLHMFGWHDDTRDPAVIARAKQRLRLAVLFQMSYPGSPAIYYGDEVGVTGGDDPYNRATYPWADQGGQPDTALLADFKKMTRMRQDHPVLRRGSIDAPIHLDEHVIVLARRLGNAWAIVATNNADTAKTVTVSLPGGLNDARFKEVLSGAGVSAEGGKLTLNVPAMFGGVWVTE